MGNAVLTVEDTVEMLSQGPSGGPHAGAPELTNAKRVCGTALGPRG